MQKGGVGIEEREGERVLGSSGRRVDKALGEERKRGLRKATKEEEDGVADG